MSSVKKTKKVCKVLQLRIWDQVIRIFLRRVAAPVGSYRSKNGSFREKVNVKKIIPIGRKCVCVGVFYAHFGSNADKKKDPNNDVIIEPTIHLRLDIFSHTTDLSIRPLSSVHLLSLQSLAMALCDGLSHCKLALAFAVLMDVVGGTALLMGVFAPLEIKGQDFGDLLVYTGMKSLMHCGMSVVGDRFGPVLGFCG